MYLLILLFSPNFYVKNMWIMQNEGYTAYFNLSGLITEGSLSLLDT